MCLAPPADHRRRGRAGRTPRRALALLALAWVVAAGRAGAQEIPAERPRARPPSMLTGRAEWEKSADLFRHLAVPPAPPLLPDEALKTFRVAAGYRLELVAAEPLVQNPVFFEFDPDGRIWVVEYQGYMLDVQGRGEGDPICRVVVLEDTDHDGRADKSTVFLDRLVMPRSLSFVPGGILLQEPPKVWFCADADGDLRCDRRTEVGTLGVAGNPQHTANGLRYGIDNWLHSADGPVRHRWRDGRLIAEATGHRGQFGVSFDESGRFITCRESSALHMDLIPAEYLVRNRHLAQLTARGGRGYSGTDVNLARDAQQVYPIRVTPGITLGARELRPDGRLRTYTIASGACFYDGDQYPEDAHGNVFVPEAGGHLIGRLKLTPGIRPVASRFHPEEQEFLASTDERFRPVNARVGPDGALYVADLYRGIIEHVIFMVPWISDQIRDRRLDTGQGMGRLYRVVRTDRPIERRPPGLSRATTAELIGHLGAATGWWRLTAQRLLVERADPAAVPGLEALVRTDDRPLARLHALWTLDGMERLSPAVKLAALADPDERVRAAAFRLCERGLDPAGDAALRDHLARAADDPSERVRLQATLTASALTGDDALPLLARLARSADDPLFPIAALTGRQDREGELLQHLLATAGAAAGSPRERALVDFVAQCVLEARSSDAAMALLDVLSATSPPAWQRETLLQALSAYAATLRRNTPPLPLPRAPQGLVALARGPDAATRQTAYRVLELFTWPGVAVASLAGAETSPLSPAQRARLERGRETYAALCAACHQPHGGGAASLAPPLAGSDWVEGAPERLVRVVLHGLYGPVQVNGQTWNLAMPGLGGAPGMDDEKVAGVLTYIRRAWGNAADPVSPALVREVRAASGQRTLPWTDAELQELGGTAAAVTPSPVAVQRPAASGEIVLPAREARVFGQRLGYRPALDVLAPWTVAEDMVEWRVELPAAGKYEVLVTLAADATSAGDFYVVETESGRVRGEVRATGDYATFQEQPAGELALRAGVNRVLLRPDGPLTKELADVRGVRLVPLRARP